MLRTALAAFRMGSCGIRYSVPMYPKSEWVIGSAFKTRSLSTDKILVQDPEAKIATIVLQNPPANSMNLEFLQEMTTTIKNLETNGKCRGFILTSEIKDPSVSELNQKEVHPKKAASTKMKKKELNIFMRKGKKIAQKITKCFTKKETKERKEHFPPKKFA